MAGKMHVADNGFSSSLGICYFTIPKKEVPPPFFLIEFL